MSHSLLSEYARALPRPRQGDEPEAWAARYRDDLEVFRRRVEARYTEGTLQRLLACPDADDRRGAAVALGLVGTMASNAPLADALHDPEDDVRKLAEDALWAVWFRGGPEECRADLQRLARLRDPAEALPGLDRLVRRAPEFAEALNQRAIAHFRLGAFGRSAADCERVLGLNPYHFGAAAGLGQCRMKQNRPRAALDAFRNALRINPNLTDVDRAVRELEQATGEGGPLDGRR